MIRWKTGTRAAEAAASAGPMAGAARFDGEFLAALEPFTLRIAQAQRGGRLAEQRSTARGQGVDFADFKPYVEGDDLRSVDWNIYRRLGKAFVRVFEERQDLPVHLLVDLSHSMFVETPPRIDAGLRTALAIASIALNQQDSVNLLSFADGLGDPVRAISGRAGLGRVLETLAGYRAQGGTGLTQALAQFSAMKLRRGLAVVISDFFDPAGAPALAEALARVPHALLLVQLVRDYDADPRLHPELQGEVQIADGESATLTPLTLNPDVLERYTAVQEDFQRRLAAAAVAARGGLVLIDAAQPVLPQLAALFSEGELLL